MNQEYDDKLIEELGYATKRDKIRWDQDSHHYVTQIDGLTFKVSILPRQSEGYVCLIHNENKDEIMHHFFISDDRLNVLIAAQRKESHERRLQSALKKLIDANE